MARSLDFAALPLAFALAACSQAGPPPTGDAVARTPDAAPAVSIPVATPRSPVVPTADATLPQVLVHKSPTCGCCGAWVAHMEAAGFAVDVVETDDLEPIRRLVGVPAGKASCHTAQVDGYFVEGHVPADDVKRLLAERPAARGITAPGMPPGSPGMELPSGETPAYRVLLVANDGGTTEFARHGD